MKYCVKCGSAMNDEADEKYGNNDSCTYIVGDTRVSEEEYVKYFEDTEWFS